MNLVEARKKLVIKRRHQEAARKSLLKKQNKEKDRIIEVQGLLGVILDSKNFPRREVYLDPFRKIITVSVWWKIKVDKRKLPKRFLGYRVKLEKAFPTTGGNEWF